MFTGTLQGGEGQCDTFANRRSMYHLGPTLAERLRRSPILSSASYPSCFTLRTCTAK